MTALFRAALVAACTAACIPTVAVGQNVSTDSLLRRVDSLQHRIADLERRVSKLEDLIRVEPSGSRAVPASPNSRDVAHWRQLRRGMKMDAVRTLLGEPEGVDGGTFTIWHYPDGASVTFYEDKVYSWSEPER